VASVRATGRVRLLLIGAVGICQFFVLAASAPVWAAPMTTVTATDDFNRADGGLGPGWAAISDGGLSIASQQVAGIQGVTAGDIRVAENFGSNQYSQIEVTSSQLAPGQWIGPTVRSQNRGLDTYVGMYLNNQYAGGYQLELFLRKSGHWTQLGSTYSLGGPLPFGTRLTVSAVGSTLSLQQNGVERIAVTDPSLTGGAPGLMAYGAAIADNWAGGYPHSVGGAVSGLSGTVVLEDNGADDLRVNGNGPFTFNALGVPGVAYNVSVKSNPSGQICTVSDGAGTVGSKNVTRVAVTCSASATTATDNFNRADGGLGAGWAAMTGGGPLIVSQHVVGTAGATVGDIRIAENYSGDQYSQIEVTSTQLTGKQWIGPTVRSQNGGLDTYIGVYAWNLGHPLLQILKRAAGTFIPLSQSYRSAPLPAGTQLTLRAAGSQILFQENGTVVIAITDGTLTGGAPGLMINGAATTDNWAGGSPPVMSGVSISPDRFRAIHVATLGLTLGEAATLSVAITQLHHGHVVLHSCLPRAQRGNTCRLQVTLMRFSFHAGFGQEAFKLPLRRLAPGHYTALITATDRAGLQSRTVGIKFSILPA
jgi:hypothetical protein